MSYLLLEYLLELVHAIYGLDDVLEHSIRRTSKNKLTVHYLKPSTQVKLLLLYTNIIILLYIYNDIKRKLHEQGFITKKCVVTHTVQIIFKD